MYRQGILLLTLLIMLTSCQFKEGFFYYLGIGNTVTFGGSDIDEVEFITTDEEGNIYLAGIFYGTTNLNPRGGEDIRSTIGGAASSDIYLIKLNADYTYGWSRVVSGLGMEKVGGLAAANGMVYLAGSIDNTTDFNSDSGGDLRGVITVGTEEVFLTAFDSSGEYRYTVTKRAPSGEPVWVERLIVDRGGNLYLFFDISSPSRIGVMKTDSEGNEIWVMEAPGGPEKKVRDAILAENGKLYCVGKMLSSGSDYYIAEIDPNGGPTKEWFFGGANDEEFISLTSDSEGLYIAGEFKMDTLIDGSYINKGYANNIVLLKVSYDYKVEWIRSFENRSSNLIKVDSLVRSSDRLFLSGSFNGTADFNTSGERLASTDILMQDIYLSTFTTGGSYLDTRFIGSSGDDYKSRLHSGRGWILWGGSFSSQFDFKIKDDGESDVRSSKGLSDVFMTIIVE